VPDNLAMEGKLYGMVKPVAPSLENIHVPVSGRRFHGILRFGDAGPGEVRDALTAALAYRRIKTAIAVDEDIDIFSGARIMWALATRVQWDRDAFQIPGLSTSNLDPFLSYPGSPPPRDRQPAAPSLRRHGPRSRPPSPSYCAASA
jgi:UbiD family decarboxylase